MAIQVQHPNNISFRVGFGLNNQASTHYLSLGANTELWGFLELKHSRLELSLTHDAAHEIYTASALPGEFVFDWPAKTINGSAMSLVLTQGLVNLPFLESLIFMEPIKKLTVGEGEMVETSQASNSGESEPKCELSYLLLIPVMAVLGLTRYDLIARFWRTQANTRPQGLPTAHHQQTML